MVINSVAAVVQKARVNKFTFGRFTAVLKIYHVQIARSRGAVTLLTNQWGVSSTQGVNPNSACDFGSELTASRI